MDTQNDENGDRRKFLKSVTVFAGIGIGLFDLIKNILGGGRSEVSVEVRKALSSQDNLIDEDEHCCMSTDILASDDYDIGRQIRMTRTDDEYALYTVSESRNESSPNIVRMGQDGRTRLGTTTGFDATISTSVCHPTYTETEARKNSEFIERLTDTGDHTGLILCAPHGGMIEPYTDGQAEQAMTLFTDNDVSSWRCKGWKSGGRAYETWHITSTDINRESFPLLDSIADRGFEYAVSFHGYSESGVLVGGGAPEELKEEVRTTIDEKIDDTDVSVEIAAGEYDGDSPENFVNWLTDTGTNGIQIEQGYDVRLEYGEAIADAISDVYKSRI